MKVLSLYCGAGGIDEGLKQSGINSNLAVDNEKDCCETIKLNHPDCEVLNSKVSDIKNSLGKFDIIVGGPPCPEFSRAKTGRTFEAIEVNLFWEIIKELTPKFWLMENVPDVIKVCKERNFLINCADYGTPQTRIRRFFTNLQKPKQTHSKTPSSDLFGEQVEKWVSVKDCLGFDGFIEDRKADFGEEKFRHFNTDKPSHTIHTDQRDFYISPSGFKDKNKKEISRNINQPSQTIVCGNSYQITNKRVYSMKYHQYPQDYEIEHKLINNELAILQGFPKSYKFYGGVSSVKKQIGNAVPPQPVRALFIRRDFED